MDLISPTETTDVSLLCSMKEDDREAFSTLFDRYWASTFDKAFKRLKDEVAAKDIVQEIFIHLWTHRQQPIANLPAYLHVAVRNRVLMLIRTKKHRESFIDPADAVFDKYLSHDATDLQRKEFYRSFELLVSTLPPKRQQIFRLRYNEELNTRDIASKMGLKQKTVQNQLGKAFDSLRGALMQLLTLVLVVAGNIFFRN